MVLNLLTQRTCEPEFRVIVRYSLREADRTCTTPCAPETCKSSSPSKRPSP